MCRDQGRRAHAQGEELDAAAVELAEHGLVGDLLVHDQHLRVVAGYAATEVLRNSGQPRLLAGIHQLNPPPESPIAPAAGNYATQPARLPEPAIPDDPGLLLVVDGLRVPGNRGCAGRVVTRH